MADDADGFLPPTQESIWKVTRQLKKEQSSLYNCVASVLSDAAFVSEVRALYPALPLLANLRCGLWYTRQADGTCYFKSTDGHNGNWSFSCTRLNWHVCELAAKQGGVIIVDATRKGKRFPDAMTKTIPIWAAVVNRAVARKRVEAAARLVASERAATEGPLPSIKPQNERDDASRHDSTLSVGPSPSRAMQQNGSVVSGTVLPQPFHSPWAACSAIDYDTSGAGGGVGSLSQWLQSPVAAAARADDSESYPAFLYPAPFSGSFTVQTPLQCPAGGDVGSSNAALPAAAELSGCRVAGAVDASGSCEGAVDPGNPCDTDLSIMEIFGEVSFGDISDAGEAALPDRDWCQLQTLMAGCEHEKHVLEADGALCGSAQSDSLAGAAEPMAAPAECLADPRDRTFFAVACPASAALPATPEVVGLSTSTTEIASRSAVDDVVEVQAALAELAKAPSAADVVVELPAMIPEVAAHPLGDDVVRLPAASPPAAGGGGCSAGALAPALPVECMDSVDLGAASASHVSCSPEEGWRWGCRFGGIVEDGGLRLHCDCGTWKCTAGGPIGNSELDHIYKLNRSSDNDFRHLKAYQHTGGKIQVKVQAQMQAQSLIDENVPVKQPGVSSPPQRQGCQQRHHHQQGPFPSHQRRQNLQLDSDLDADGSGGSCSDTCSPAALSGLASTRSTSSSSSSLSASRSSSCSSGHSDGAARVGVKATATSGGGSRIVRACIGVEPFIPQCQPFPRHYTYSASSPSHLLAGKARRCGSLPPRPGAISCGVGNGNRLSSSGGGSSCSSRSTGSASCSAPSSNTCSNTSSSSNSRNSSVGGGVPAVDVCASAHDGAGADGGDGWDVGLHLPLWVSSNERAQIERRLDGWVDALLRVGADVEGLSAVLRKPLRPLWISQSSTIWVDQVAQPDQLPFTPLYLVSASQPHSYLRQAGGTGGSGSDADGDNSHSCHANASMRHHRKKQNHHEQQPHAWTYVYVPGAGDDEESWAEGLTPPVFWAHYTELLQAGPNGVHEAVRQILQREAAALAERGTNSSIFAEAAMATATPLYVAPTDQHHLLPAGCRGGGGALAAGPGRQFFIGPTGFALGDLAAGAAPGCWEQVDAVLSCGIHEHPSMVGEPRWPYGGLTEGLETVAEVESDTMEEHGVAAAALAAAVVMSVEAGPKPGQPHGCGTAAHATDVQGANAGAAAGQPAAPLEGVLLELPEPAAVEASRREVVGDPEGKLEGVPGGFSFLPPVLGCVDGPAPSGQAARCLARRSGGADDAGQDPLECPAIVGSHKHQRSHRHHHHQNHHHPRDQDQHHHAQCHRLVPRYLHLPVQHFKHNRISLIQHLDAALGFLSYHLSRGRKVLIHDTNGLDTCVCIAVALLLACYDPHGSSEASAPAWKRPYRTAAEAGTSLGGKLVPRVITKDAVRQCLAYVSGFYPHARPTRGMLRQVFNHFVRAQCGGSGGEAAGAVVDGVE